MSRLKTIQLYLSDLKELLASKDFGSARACLREIGPIDLADGWPSFTREERLVIFRLYPRDKAVQLFEELEPDEESELIQGLHDDAAAERLIEEIDPAQAGQLLRRLPKNLVAKLSGIMRKSARECAQRFSEYPTGTVGSLVRSRFVPVDETWTAKQALERIQLGTRLRRIEDTHLDPILVTHPDGRLAGTIPLKALVVAPRDMSVRDIMDEAPIVLDPAMDQEEAVNLFTRYKLKGAPVVTKAGEVLGLVVVKDIFDVAQEEVEEDFAKMAGVQAGLGHLSSFEQAKRRLPWLIITCFGGLLVSYVVKSYEGTLSKIIALATFSPLIAGMGGNVGSQTATIVVRALATGEVKPGGEREIIFKEIGVGMILGVTYGIALGLTAFLFYGARFGWKLSVVVAIAMFFSMTLSSTMASLEPFILRHFGQDPATATGPLITTTTDLFSNLLYFSLATWLLLGR
jgi:magnesium transporter